MSLILLICAATLFVAYANGANDNFKGVATLFGSATTGYRKALAWATVTTLLGSIASYFLAGKLLKTFSGKGLVPDAVVGDPAFMAAVIVGAGLTVFFAARAGIPISTTHSLMGGLLGAGFVAASAEIQWAVLEKKILLPLLVSPLLSMALTVMIYPALRGLRKVLRVTKNTCVCVGRQLVPVTTPALTNGMTLTPVQLQSLNIIVDEQEVCDARVIDNYAGRLFGINVQSALDSMHFLSAGAMSFARGLNDTPKIVALCVASGTFGLGWNIGMVATAMALGGILSARKVAETMSLRITAMNHGQGFTANLITAIVVIFASRLGLPVSTTHVSCGSLFGIGAINGSADRKLIGGIVSAWALTVPVAAIISGLTFSLLSAG
ncbi:MAG: inorganic phosphate transporter [Candidatus Omnitrophota bacterium]|nr:inorganic phosphate transporter [Candidatus Omnitrophota bacterium]